MQRLALSRQRGMKCARGMGGGERLVWNRGVKVWLKEKSRKQAEILARITIWVLCNGHLCLEGSCLAVNVDQVCMRGLTSGPQTGGTPLHVNQPMPAPLLGAPPQNPVQRGWEQALQPHCPLEAALGARRSCSHWPARADNVRRPRSHTRAFHTHRDQVYVYRGTRTSLCPDTQTGQTLSERPPVHTSPRLPLHFPASPALAGLPLANATDPVSALTFSCVHAMVLSPPGPPPSHFHWRRWRDTP